MSQLLLISQIFVFLITGLGLWLAFLVLLTDRRSRVNQTFFAMTIFILLWVIFAYLGFSAVEPKNSLIWYRLNLGVVSLFLTAAYFFSIYFPKKIEESRLTNKIVIFLGGSTFLLSVFTDLIVESARSRQWGMEILFGSGKIFYYGIVILLTFLTLYFLFKKYFVLPKEEKLKIQYFLIGISIFALMNIIFNVIFAFFFGTVEFQQFGDYSAIFLLGFTAFAIIKKDLFGTKVVLTALLVGLIAVLLFLDAFIFTQGISLQITKGVIWAIFIFFGFLLIQSTQKEVKRKEEAESLLKAKTEFLSIASHQLRTPLTAIIGYSSMLKEGDYGAIPEKAGKAVAHIYDSSQRMIKLVNDFLSVSRMETGKTILKIQETSMNELIGQVIAGLELRAKEKNLYLEYNRPTKDHIANIDPAKIKEVLSNLIDNAIHYTEKGGITVTVQKNGKITVIISDTGAGMTPEEITSLFESFSRGSAGNELNTQGSGLGLYIAKKFVEMHNGEIHAASGGKDNGSTFYVELPGK